MATRKLRQMPEMPEGERHDLGAFVLSDAIEERWDQTLQATDDAPRVVMIAGVIGYPEWAEGTTAKMVARKLEELGSGDIVARINSPGGSFFEGQAIHNLLRQHDGKVTVEVLGVAASAASVIAMAGDEIVMPKTAWLMIHNVSGITAGDKRLHQKAIDVMAKFDEVSADLYAERSGKTYREIVQMMDAETFLGGADAVEQGFADRLMADGKVKDSGKKQQSMFANAKKLLETAGQKGGLSRSDVRGAIAQLRSTGTLRAADPATLRAGDVDLSGLSGAVDTLSQSIAGLQGIVNTFKRS